MMPLVLAPFSAWATDCEGTKIARTSATNNVKVSAERIHTSLLGYLRGVETLTFREHTKADITNSES
jgi:hypothetical protein